MEYIAVAEVLNTHGIKGCLKMRPLTDNIERFDEDICYYLGDKKVEVNIQNYSMFWVKNIEVIIGFPIK